MGWLQLALLGKSLQEQMGLTYEWKSKTLIRLEHMVFLMTMQNSSLSDPL